MLNVVIDRCCACSQGSIKRYSGGNIDSCDTTYRDTVRTIQVLY